MPDKSYISKYGMDASKNGVNHLEKTFSGYVEYNDSGYRPLFVYRVKDGKVLQRLDLRKQVKVVSKKKGVGVSSDCEECEPEYEVVCEEIEDPDATNGVGWECTDVFIGLNCYPMPCPGGGGEDPDDCSNPNNADLPECSFEDEEECEYYGTCEEEEPEPPNPCAQYGPGAYMAACGCIGGTTGITACPDPCAEATRLEQNTNYRNEMLDLQGKTGLNKEVGYLKLKNQNSQYKEGPVGAYGIAYPLVGDLQNNSVEYISHTHNVGTLSLSIFSFTDIELFSKYVGEGKAIDDSFTLSVTTSQGTSYALVIDDRTKFTIFYNSYIKSAAGKATFNSFMNSSVSHTNSSTQNEFNLVQLLQNPIINSGIRILKSNSTFTDWQALKLNTTTNAIYNPCN